VTVPISFTLQTYLCWFRGILLFSGNTFLLYGRKGGAALDRAVAKPCLLFGTHVVSLFILVKLANHFA